jgi:hypothetical protein
MKMAKKRSARRGKGRKRRRKRRERSRERADSCIALLSRLRTSSHVLRLREKGRKLRRDWREMGRRCRAGRKGVKVQEVLAVVAVLLIVLPACNPVNRVRGRAKSCEVVLVVPEQLSLFSHSHCCFKLT